MQEGKVHYRHHKKAPPDPNLSQFHSVRLNRTYIPYSDLSNTFLQIFWFSSAFCTSNSSQHSWHNRTRTEVQNMDCLVT